MSQITAYFFEDPLRVLYLVGGSGGLWYWINEWRNRTRIKIRILSETCDPNGSTDIVETQIEITNLGDSVTSVDSSVIFKALTPEREVVYYQFEVTSHERTLMPHVPKTITLRSIRDSKYDCTWYRTYEVRLSRGLNATLRTKNASNNSLTWWQYHIGYFLFKTFNWLP